MIRLLNDVVIEWERVRTVAAKMDNSLAEMKRDGSFVLKSAHRLMTNSKDSNLFWNNCLMQQKYLRRILKLLEGEQGRQEVVTQLQDLKASLTKKVVLFVASDFDKLESPIAPWRSTTLRKLNSEEINLALK